MSSANELRAILMDHGKKLVEHKAKRAVGIESQLPAHFMSKEDQEDVWKALVPMLQQASDPIESGFTDADVGRRVEKILAQVSDGTLTPKDGKQLMTLVSVGFEITELPELMSRLSDLT